MMKSIVGLIFGLVIGVYLAASYPEVAIRNIQKIGVPMLGAKIQSPGVSQHY